MHVSVMAQAKGPPQQQQQQQHQHQPAPLLNGRPMLDKSMAPPPITNGRLSSFVKPKIIHEPQPPLQQLQPMAPPPVVNSAAATPSSGGDVEIILKMMTSMVDPLSKIAATPRTDLAEVQPQKQHKYVELPPLYKPTTKPRKFSP